MFDAITACGSSPVSNGGQSQSNGSRSKNDKGLMEGVTTLKSRKAPQASLRVEIVGLMAKGLRAWRQVEKLALSVPHLQAKVGPLTEPTSLSNTCVVMNLRLQVQGLSVAQEKVKMMEIERIKSQELVHCLEQRGELHATPLSFVSLLEDV